MSIENLTEEFLNNPDDKHRFEQEKVPQASGHIEDDIIETLKIIDGEIHKLQLRVRESKDAKLQNAAEFQKELDDAKQEFKTWKKLLRLAVGKRKPTLAEAAALKEERLEALTKATEAAQSVGVTLEEVPEALREAARAVFEREPLDISRMETTEFQSEGMKLRERERVLREADFWLKKATIIQALMEIGVAGEITSSKDPSKNTFEKKMRRIVGVNEIIKLPAIAGGSEREVRIVKTTDKVIVECAKFGDAVEVIEKMEREGLPSIGIVKGLGLIDLKTGRIDQQKVEIRFFVNEPGNVRKSISLNYYTEA